MPVSNPFSTRFTRPGALPFVFPPQETAESTVRRFASLGWHAQIIGPHGAGKSTLVAALLPELEAARRPACVFALRDGQRRLPAGWKSVVRSKRAGTVVVDGYEQLNRWSRWRLRSVCRREGWSLLVTSHHDVGMPTLCELCPSVETVRLLAERLLGARAAVISAETIAERFAACDGNVRETWFALYDCFEQSRFAEDAAACCDG